MLIELFNPEEPITKPGFYRMTEQQYHADPCASPSLSASLIKRALPMGKGTGSMRHLRYAHPKLTPIPLDEEQKSAMTFGNAFHKLILGEGPDIVVVEAADWKTNAAKEKRDLALANGFIPVLTGHYEQALLMETLVREQVAQWPELDRIVSADGWSEIVAVWIEETMHGPIFCRSMIDRLPAEGAWLLDWKTTMTSAGPDDFGRYLFDQGADIQAYLYARGVKALTGRTMGMLFAAVEQYVPHAIMLHGIDRAAMAMAERKVLYGIETYAACLAADVWPGYPAHVAWQEAPPWHERKWIEREDAGMTSTEYLLRLIESSPDKRPALDAETAADFGIE